MNQNQLLKEIKAAIAEDPLFAKSVLSAVSDGMAEFAEKAKRMSDSKLDLAVLSALGLPSNSRDWSHENTSHAAAGRIVAVGLKLRERAASTRPNFCGIEESLLALVTRADAFDPVGAENHYRVLKG